MKVSKHLHACLYVQENGLDILIDPGMFTHDEKVLDLTTLPKLDFIFYTHEHFDHLSVPYLKEILVKFPAAKVITNQSIVSILDKEHIKADVNTPEWVTIEDAHHEKLVPGMPMPENTAFTLFNRLTHPGDSLSFTKTADVLALPVQAPWGSMTWAIEKALELHPKIIIPIHDWHWKDEARHQLYGMMEKVFAGKGIEFKSIETGEVIEIV